MFAALIIGHHFSISDFCNAPRASGVCCSRDGISCTSSVSRARTLASASALTTAELSRAMTSFEVFFGAQSPVKGRFFDRAGEKLSQLARFDTNELVPVDLRAMAGALSSYC